MCPEYDEVSYAEMDSYSSISPLRLFSGTTYYRLYDPSSDSYVDSTAGIPNLTISGIRYVNGLQYFGETMGAALNMNGLLEGYYTAKGYTGLFGPTIRYTPVPISGDLWLLGSGVVFLA